MEEPFPRDGDVEQTDQDRRLVPAGCSRFRGTDNGQTVFFQHIILGKGRVGYFLDMYGLNTSTVADRALFKQMYTTWRPTVTGSARRR